MLARRTIHRGGTDHKRAGQIFRQHGVRVAVHDVGGSEVNAGFVLHDVQQVVNRSRSAVDRVDFVLLGKGDPSGYSPDARSIGGGDARNLPTE